MHRAAGSSTEAYKSIDNVTLGGAFDAKVVKIHALYGYNNTDMNVSGTDVRIDNYMLGLSVPVGKVTLKGSYWLSDGNKQAGGNAQQYAVGANYAFSKRTDLYTAYSYIDNDSADRFNTLRRAASVGDASNSGNTFQQGFQVGVRHTF
jgi:predicted porin